MRELIPPHKRTVELTFEIFTEQVVLDDEDDFWYQIDKIESGWIYYQKGNGKYKIDINGNNKVKIK